jgi:hypothetical protein
MQGEPRAEEGRERAAAHLHDDLVHVIGDQGCLVVVLGVAVGVHDLDTAGRPACMQGERWLQYAWGYAGSSPACMRRCPQANCPQAWGNAGGGMQDSRLSEGLHRVLVQVGDGNAGSQLPRGRRMSAPVRIY